MFNVIILGLTSLFTDISSEMVYPILPLYLTLRLGASPVIVGLIEGIAESLASILKVFSGYFSDKFGKRKPFALFGYSSSTVGKLFLYLSGSWWHVLFSRAVDRFGKGVREAPRDALIADSITDSMRGRSYGLHRTLDSLGAVIGVILAYCFLTVYKSDYKKVFFYSLIPASLAVVILLLVKETQRNVPKRPINLNPPVSTPKFNFSSFDRRLKAFLLIVFLFTLGNSSNQFLLLRAKNLGFLEGNIILLYLVYNLVYSFFSYPAGRLSDKIGRKTLLVGGYLFYGLVYMGFAVVRSPSSLWLLFVLYGVYIASTQGVEKAFIADLAPENLRGTLMGMHSTLVGVGLFPASLLAGIFWNLWGAPAPFYFGGILGILASLGLLLLI